MDPQWFCKLLGRELGPLDFDELVEWAHAGTLTPNDQVRPEGTDAWSPAGEIPGLFDPSEGEPVAPPPQGAAPTGRRRAAWTAVALSVVAVSALGVWWFSADSSTPGLGGSSAQAGTMGDLFSQDFREGCLPQTIHLVSGPHPRIQFCKLGPAGLRFTLPEESKANYFAASPRIVIKGDFEATAGYTILNVPRPTKGFGAGARIAIEDPEGERAAVQRLHREREGHVVSSYRGLRQEDDTYEHSVRMLPVTNADTTSGSLRLVRRGPNVEYYAAGAGETEFTQIHTEEFPLGDVAQLHLGVHTGGSPTAVDVAWTYLDVRADELVRDYQPPEPSRFWSRLLLVLLAVGLIAAGCLAVWLWLARRAYLHPSEPAPETT
ncbi:MAG: DUF1583 domain-containing protein [Planctomycetes bacterium]|nr:DUF1583 domain-containing protein [Planctomycetota bacterium]